MATNSRFHKIVWSDLEERISPRDVRRYVQLASVLEPISEKDGCTTRTRDLCKYQKLEYFLSAGINIGDAFEDLATRIYTTGFPCQAYDLCYRAQADSKKNRCGGRVNQGIIEFLFPIVISQISSRSSNDKEIISAVPTILKSTTPQDTIWLQRMQNLAFEMSGYYNRKFPIKPNANILTYYQKRLEDSVKPSDKYHNEEITNNYPTLRFMLEKLSKSENPSLSTAMQSIYNKVRQDKPDMPTGIIADLIACVIYLQLSCERTSKIVQ